MNKRWNTPYPTGDGPGKIDPHKQSFLLEEYLGPQVKEESKHMKPFHRTMGTHLNTPMYSEVYNEFVVGIIADVYKEENLVQWFGSVFPSISGLYEEITTTELNFLKSIAEPSPPGAPTLFTGVEVESYKQGQEWVGFGMSLPIGFHLDEQGRQIYNMYIANISYAIMMASKKDLWDSLMRIPDPYLRYIGETTTNMSDLTKIAFKRHRDGWNRIHEDKYAYHQIEKLTNIEEVEYSDSQTDTWIVTEDIDAFVTMRSPEITDYYKAGGHVGGPFNKLDTLENTKTIGASQFVVQRKIKLSKKVSWHPLTKLQTIGEFFIFPNGLRKNYTDSEYLTNARTIRIYDAYHDMMKPISMGEALKHTGILDDDNELNEYIFNGETNLIGAMKESMISDEHLIEASETLYDSSIKVIQPIESGNKRYVYDPMMKREYDRALWYSAIPEIEKMMKEEQYDESYMFNLIALNTDRLLNYRLTENNFYNIPNDVIEENNLKKWGHINYPGLKEMTNNGEYSGVKNWINGSINVLASKLQADYPESIAFSKMKHPDTILSRSMKYSPAESWVKQTIMPHHNYVKINKEFIEFLNDKTYDSIEKPDDETYDLPALLNGADGDIARILEIYTAVVQPEPVMYQYLYYADTLTKRLISFLDNQDIDLLVGKYKAKTVDEDIEEIPAFDGELPTTDKTTYLNPSVIKTVFKEFYDMNNIVWIPTNMTWSSDIWSDADQEIFQTTETNNMSNGGLYKTFDLSKSMFLLSDGDAKKSGSIKERLQKTTSGGMKLHNSSKAMIHFVYLTLQLDKENIKSFMNDNIQIPLGVCIFRKDMVYNADTMVRVKSGGGTAERTIGGEIATQGEDPTANLHIVNMRASIGTRVKGRKLIYFCNGAAVTEHIDGEGTKFYDIKNTDFGKTLTKRDEKHLVAMIIPFGMEYLKDNLLDLSGVVNGGALPTLDFYRQKYNFASEDLFEPLTELRYLVEEEKRKGYPMNSICWAGPYEYFDFSVNKWKMVGGRGHWKEAYDGCAKHRFGKTEKK